MLGKTEGRRRGQQDEMVWGCKELDMTSRLNNGPLHSSLLSQ